MTLGSPANISSLSIPPLTCILSKRLVEFFLKKLTDTVNADHQLFQAAPSLFLCLANRPDSARPPQPAADNQQFERSGRLISQRSDVRGVLLDEIQRGGWPSNAS